MQIGESVNVNNDRGNQRKIGVILSYGALASNFLISIVYTPFLLSSLGKSEYGNYQYVSSIVSYLSLLTCGFGGAYLRFATPYKKIGNKDGVAKINGLFLLLFLFMGTVALIIGGGMTFFSDYILGGKLTSEELSTSKVLMAVMVVNLFTTFPVSIFNSYIIAQERFIFQKGLNLFRTYLSPIVCVVVLHHGGKSVGIAVATLIVSLVIDLLTVCYCFGKLKMKIIFSKSAIPQAKEVFIFSSYLLLSMIVDQINWSVDKYLLGKLCGTAAVAVYTVGATINTYYKSVGESISNVYVPKVYDIIGEENGDRLATELMTQLGRIQALVLFLISSGFIVFGKQFLNLWVGPDYSDCYYIILLLIIPVTIPEIQKIGLEIQRAKNLHKFRSILYAVIAVINIIISIPLSMTFGPIGAAVGTAITVLIGNGLIMNVYYHLKINLDMKYYWAEITKLMPTVIITCIIGCICTYLYACNSWLKLCIGVIVYVLLYCVFVWLFGLNYQEKKRIINSIRAK